MQDNFGDRMKLYEQAEAGRRLMPLLPALARLDGKAFHKFTHSMRRPYDERLSRLMVDTTKYLVQAANACMGYTQSGTGPKQFMSGYVTEWATTDPVGQMERPVLIPAGQGTDNSTDTREGDMSSTQVDMADGTFWSTQEFTETGDISEIEWRRRLRIVQEAIDAMDDVLVHRRTVRGDDALPAAHCFEKRLLRTGTSRRFAFIPRPRISK